MRTYIQILTYFTSIFRIDDLGIYLFLRNSEVWKLVESYLHPSYILSKCTTFTAYLISISPTSRVSNENQITLKYTCIVLSTCFQTNIATSTNFSLKRKIFRIMCLICKMNCIRPRFWLILPILPSSNVLFVSYYGHVGFCICTFTDAEPMGNFE